MAVILSVPASRSHRERVVWPTPTSLDKEVALGPPGDANRRTILALKAVEYTTIALSFLPHLGLPCSWRSPTAAAPLRSSNLFDNYRDHHSTSSHMVRSVCWPAQLLRRRHVVFLTGLVPGITYSCQPALFWLKGRTLIRPGPPAVAFAGAPLTVPVPP